jgi:hypothetical protein
VPSRNWPLSRRPAFRCHMSATAPDSRVPEADFCMCKIYIGARLPQDPYIPLPPGAVVHKAFETSCREVNYGFKVLVITWTCRSVARLSFGWGDHGSLSPHPVFDRNGDAADHDM